MSEKRMLSTLVLLLCAGVAPAALAADERQSLEELRNTVINLLDALVKRGVVSQEQASAMVADAQAKATADAEARASQQAAEAGAVRVTYVPEVVRQQIRDEMRAELRKDVADDVVARAREEQWGIPGALPSWIAGIRLSGDIRLRLQGDSYADDNARNAYLDVLAVNGRGGVFRAGDAAFLNTSENRLRERIRLRLGLDAKLNESITAGVRLSTGNTSDPVSTNQTIGQYGARHALVVDQAYLRYDARRDGGAPWLTLWGGRAPNPFLSTDLVFDSDLGFDGVTAQLRVPMGEAAQPRGLALTLGAYPLQEVELSAQDKWLFGGQLGFDWTWSGGARVRLGAAYYHYDNITGVRNAADSTRTDFTAPRWLQKGNTLFDIRNDTDTSTNLFALAAEYRLVNLTGSLELPVGAHRVFATADLVRNVGYDEADVRARTGFLVPERADGYQFEVGFGTPRSGHQGDWRAWVAYRYLQRDAVLDAFTDSDFHLGGTDAKGFTLRGEWWFKERTSLSVRYMSSSEIDGPPLGIDTLMIDINGQF